MKNSLSMKLVHVYFAISVLFILSFFGILLIVAEFPRVRYNPNFYETIYGQNGTVDIAFGGSSRINRAVHAPALSSYLEAFYGRPPIIYKLGLGGGGTDAQLRTLIDLVETRDVGYVFFQYYTHDQITHQNLIQIGTLWDILFTPIPGQSFFGHVAWSTNQIYLRISKMLDRCVAQIRVCSNSEVSRPLASLIRSAPGPLNIEEFQRVLRDRRELSVGEYFMEEPRSWDVRQAEDARTAHYLDQLISLAKAKGTTVVLLDIPRFGWDTVSAGTVANMEERFGVDFVSLSTEDLQKLGETGFADPGHVGIRGEPYFRRMIAEYIISNNIEYN